MLNRKIMGLLIDKKVAGLWMLLTLIASAQAAEYRVERLEPEFWWAGMQHEQLQLLVYGPNIAELTPSIKYPGVKLLRVTPAENPNYLFVELALKRGIKPGQFTIDFKRGKDTIIRHPYTLYARAKGSAARQGFDSSDAIYLITPDRFANGKSENDAMPGSLEQPERSSPGGRHGGDIAGMRNHLNYIADMGFTQIWSNPLLENNQPNYSYHGYAITDLYKVDERFGSNAEYREFVAAARLKGIGVIQDIILNHIGSEHWWMRDLPSADWLNSRDHYVETNHARTSIHDHYAADFDRTIFTDGWFVTTMPDLNQRNPQLAQYLIQNTIWWVEYAGLSGIRTDTYSYPDKHFLTEWSRRVMTEYPNFNIVGEEWSGNPAIVAYWQRGKKNHDGYVSHTPSMMDFPLREALLEGLQEGNVWHGGLFKSYEMLANDFLYADPRNMVIFEGNHDTARIFSLLDEDFGLYQMAMTYFATMRGIPQFFYGTEILMTSPKERNDGVVRSDFPGGWAGDKVNAFTGVGLTEQQQSAQSWLKQLLNWRKASPVIHHGRLKHFAPHNGVYVYFRYTDAAKVMVILNNSQTATPLAVERYQEMLGDSTSAKDVLNGKSYDLTQPMLLPSTSALILELK